MKNPELPPGVKPGDSDPPPQTPLVGCVRATVTVSLVCEIYSTDKCETQEEAIKIMRHLVESCFHQTPGLSMDSEYTNCNFEAE